MSFNNEARIVKDESMPLGRRYMALRHCVELYCPLGFNGTWKILEARFGLREGQAASSQALTAAINFLELDRQAWLKYSQAHQELVHLRKKNGFPKPLIGEKNGRTL